MVLNLLERQAKRLNPPQGHLDTSGRPRLAAEHRLVDWLPGSKHGCLVNDAIGLSVVANDDDDAVAADVPDAATWHGNGVRLAVTNDDANEQRHDADVAATDDDGSDATTAAAACRLAEAFSGACQATTASVLPVPAIASRQRSTSPAALALTIPASAAAAAILTTAAVRL